VAVPAAGVLYITLECYVSYNTLHLHQEEIEKLKGKLTGVAEENEKIMLKIVSIHELWCHIYVYVYVYIYIYTIHTYVVLYM
jgi:hypothetical protein